MSLPTRIYLGLTALLIGGWFLWSLAGPGGVGLSRADFRSDPDYLLHHAGKLRLGLGGRIQVRDAIGDPVEIPPGSLTVVVRAEGEVAVELSDNVGPDGAFEILGLPEGEATVSVELGAGGVVSTIEGVRLAAHLPQDPRLELIDLTGIVFPFTLGLEDTAGAPCPAGHVAWRPSLALAPADGGTFGGVAVVRGGRARFLASADPLDVVSLVPGCSIEVFEMATAGDRLALGVGTTVELTVTGERPDPGEWSLRAVLLPADGQGAAATHFDPTLGAAVQRVWRNPAGELDGEGRARIPVLTQEGSFVLRYVARKTRRGSNVEFTLPDGSDQPIALVDAMGTVRLERPFPMDGFTARLDAVVSR